MMYLVSPAHQFPQQIFPSPNPTQSRVLHRSNTNLHSQTTSYNTLPATQTTFSRADTPSPRTPLLDLSVVKPMTASCLNTPAPPDVQARQPSNNSPIAGPSGIQARSGMIRVQDNQ